MISTIRTMSDNSDDSSNMQMEGSDGNTKVTKTVSFKTPPKAAVRSPPKKIVSVRLGPKRASRSLLKEHYDHITGMVTKRQQNIRLLDRNEPPKPQWWQLRRRFLMHCFGDKPTSTTPQAQKSEDLDPQQKHYRVTAVVPVGSTNFFLRRFFMPMRYDNWIAHYLRWSFRSNFWFVLLSILLSYWSIIIFFAVFIFWYGSHQPQCIGGDITGKVFMDSFHLSWTTLSTVGYGVTYPKTYYKKMEKAASGILLESIDPSCLGINTVMAYESFVGVLFGSITGAIIFGKIARIQTMAQVRFSDPICVRYGSGVQNHAKDRSSFGSDANEDSDDDDDEVNDDGTQLPCPVLEFRLLNDLSHIRGGGIMNASVHVVAITPLRSGRVGDETAGATPTALEDHALKGLRKSLGGKSPSKDSNGAERRRSSVFQQSKDKLSEGHKTGSSSSSASTTTPVKENGTEKRRSSIFQQSKETLSEGKPAVTAARRHSIFQSSAGTDDGDDTTHHSGRTKQNSHLASFLSPSALTHAITQPGRSLLGVGKTVGGMGKAVGGSILQQLNWRLASAPEQDILVDMVDNADEKEHYNETDLEAALEEVFEAHMLEKLRRAQKEIMRVQSASIMTEPSQSRVIVTEGDSRICPAREFHKLEIETDTHPFFKRAWIVRHVLDASSPLLSEEAQALIEENNGFWPAELNNYVALRKHLFFNQLIVNFNGTAHGSGSSVFAHQIYNFEDVSIGYTFVSMLRKDLRHKKLVMEKEFFNHVQEQAGGGGEPLEEFKTARDSFSLQTALSTAHMTVAHAFGGATSQGLQVARGAATETMDFVGDAAVGGLDVMHGVATQVTKKVDDALGPTPDANV